MIKPNTVYEIFDQVQKAATQEERIQVLKDNNCLAIRDVLRASFDDTIVFTLPAGDPPYKDSLSKEGMSPTNLIRSTNRFTYFVKGGLGDQLKAVKRETMFLALLEGIHPLDAKIVCAMKDKKLQELYPALSKELTKAVWPKLILS